MKYLYLRSLKHRFIYLAVTILFGFLLLYISTLPYSTIEESVYPQISDLFDMMNHFIGFSLFNFLLLSTFVAFSRQRICEKGLFLYFAIGIVWGLLCEGSQYFNSTRSFQLMDMAANTLPTLPIFLLMKNVPVSKT